MLKSVKYVTCNERGATLVLVALSLTVLLGMGALAIDAGMLYTARTELQRTADAAALAGASAFIDSPNSMAADPARQRAMEYATANPVRGELLVPAQIDVQVLLAEEKVRVAVRSTAKTLFATIFNVDLVGVATIAAAHAAVGGTQGVCVKPLAVPDPWLDNDDDDGNRMNRI